MNSFKFNHVLFFTQKLILFLIYDKNAEKEINLSKFKDAKKSKGKSYLNKNIKPGREGKLGFLLH